MRKEVVFSFGPFRLFPGRQLLTLDGSAIKLGGRAFELLHLLVQRDGELVSKNELMRVAWPDIFVHESNLKVNMHSLRRSLGDTQKQPLYIATVPGRGYRFISPVQQGTADIVDVSTAPQADRLSRLPLLSGAIGREREIADLLALLQSESQVTVLGAAGVGKTTVAVAAAHAVVADYPDGVCFVDLSAIDDPTFLPAAMVAALGLRGDMGDPLAAVIDHLQRRTMLILLDNCEHVLPAVAIFARKFHHRAGRSKLLATSREPLGIPSESAMWLDPLAFFPSDAPASLEEILRFPAVELFVSRAYDWSGYQVTDRDSAAVAQICRALEGLPLALELAAGKLESYTVQGLVAALDKQLAFSNNRSKAASVRHETLLSTIDWSFNLLSRNEATIFCLVSAFADRFELDDAVSVAAAQELSPVDVIAGLGSLVTKSLLVAEATGPGISYRLLDSTRRYAIWRRQEAGLDALARRAHVERIVALFEQSETEWGWRDNDDWTQRYLGRAADVRVALAWAFSDGGDRALGVRLTAATIPLWFETSLVAEAQTRVEVALEFAETFPCNDNLKTKLALSRAWSMIYRRRFALETYDAWLTAIAYARRASNLHSELQALVGLSIYLMDIGRFAEAIQKMEEFRSLCARHRDWSLAPEGERSLACIKAHAGEITEALAKLESLAAEFARPSKGSRMAGFQVDRYIGIRCYVPLFAWVSGRPDYGARLAHDVIGVAESLGHLMSQSNVLALSACPVSYYCGDLDALERYTRKLSAILQLETFGVWVPMQQFYASVLGDLRGEPGSISRVKKSIDELIDSRFSLRLPGCLGVLAELLVRHGRLDEASDAITTAKTYESRHGERWCRSELMRVEALILSQSGFRTLAERLLLNALDEAHSIDAHSFELRIASDLAAQYIEVGRSSDAAALLRPIFERFTEGFATKDLIAASRILRHAAELTS
jgi:predicted ATPase/DNA-binding winged helix-turn-helix (wHTH) protein